MKTSIYREAAWMLRKGFNRPLHKFETEKKRYQELEKKLLSGQINSRKVCPGGKQTALNWLRRQVEINEIVLSNYALKDSFTIHHRNDLIEYRPVLNYRILTAERKIKYAGTDKASWLQLWDAKMKVNHEAGEMIYEYDEKGRPLWECL